MYRIGIDIGSTTAKIVVLDDSDGLFYFNYIRHNAEIKERLIEFIDTLIPMLGQEKVSVHITGSIGLGVSEKCGIAFVQEVIAASRAILHTSQGARTMIDIGGEDAKVVFFRDGEATDLRMNGNCAGGTGAFLDQMSVILGVDIDEMNDLALQATEVYPIASRCGVFCKTDIQNLIAKNVSKANIAASIFRAVAVQTVVTLAHGEEISAPVVFCGGPLSYFSALRKAFVDYLSLDQESVIIPNHSTLLPAMGSAYTETEGAIFENINQFKVAIEHGIQGRGTVNHTLGSLFRDKSEYAQWKEKMCLPMACATLSAGKQEAYLGIDSGSTTTKIVLIDSKHRLLYTDYGMNNGNPIMSVERGLQRLDEECKAHGTELIIRGAYSTGYGEDLIRSAFQLDGGIVETMAHYMGALDIDPEVSFILDIGGQDMKAIFVKNGVIERIEINEACSSGCGTFIETFAQTLGFSSSEFSHMACLSESPSDLGTRCTVFMNSKVKHELRDGASVSDISAGLCYSVIKNCLYKVLKLKNVGELGHHLVVQGGTMRNDGVVRALELETGVSVKRYNHPELMGAYGCALYALNQQAGKLTLDDMLQKAVYTERNFHCKGCENSCLVIDYKFGNGKHYYSGNKCERIVSSGLDKEYKRDNAVNIKYSALFERNINVSEPKLRLGIPRCLSMYESYPFWHALFSHCNIEVCLSDESTFKGYEQHVKRVMSDNICFPAKMVHSHIENLKTKGVDRIFLPFIIYEQRDDSQNSYNCPIVTGYSEVIKSVDNGEITIDSPAIGFNNEKLLYKQCTTLLRGYGATDNEIKTAFHIAIEEQKSYCDGLIKTNEQILNLALQRNELVVMLGCRPYHIDPVIHHKVSEMLTGLGVHVITDDFIRDKEITLHDVHYLAQWSTSNRIIKAAKWCANQGTQVQFVQLTSFGCGPDSFLIDEVRDLLMRYSKPYTFLKLDDINNIGSLKLRVRSMIESLKVSLHADKKYPEIKLFETVPVYDSTYRNRKLLVPFFTPFLSPLIPALLNIAGYEAEGLPLSDKESSELGLRYANNEICYPATLIVGDIVKAFKSGKYNPDECGIIFSQTGGQCRASNYLMLMKKGLVEAGYKDVPVIGLTFGGGIENHQPGFTMNWFKLVPYTLRAVLYSDCIGKFYHATAAREKSKGLANKLKEKYLQLGFETIKSDKFRELNHLLADAAVAFNEACFDIETRKVGVVGEIYLKYHSYAQKNITEWLMSKQIEIVPPVMLDFFIQAFVNRDVNVQTHVEERSRYELVMKLAYKLIKREVDKTNKIASAFNYFTPFHNIYESAAYGSEIISLSTQFGEGWLLPAEIATLSKQGVKNIVSLQPFGCIANHIVSQGVFKRIKKLYPDLNLMSLDFDSGVSDVNIVNRMLLFTEKVEKE